MKLTISNLHKSFGEKHVLKGITFSAESGRAFGLLGRNGAGKTTTIRIMMGVFPQDDGMVIVDDRAIDRKNIRFGYLPEERGLYAKKKIIDQLVYFAELNGLTKTEATSSVDYWLNRLGMSEYRNKRLDTLSKGNQQKIQLITALAHNPDIVILDEPFSGLDPVNALLLESVVKEQVQKGKILIFSSHQMSYIEQFCDDIAIINEGEIVITGSLRDIKHAYPRNKLFVLSPDKDKILSDIPNSKEEGGGIIITLDSPDQKGETIDKLNQNYDIDQIGVFEPSLQDIFVEYAGDKEDRQ